MKKLHIASYSVLVFLIIILSLMTIALSAQAKENSEIITKLKSESEINKMKTTFLNFDNIEKDSKIEELEKSLKNAFEKVYMAAAMSPLRGIVSDTEIVNLMDEIPHGYVFNGGYTITAGFGLSVGANGKARTSHTGTDIIPINPEDLSTWDVTPIDSGIVENIGIDSVLGKYVIIRHSDNVRSLYAHLAKIYYTADIGMEVKPDSVLGIMGNSGLVYSDFKKGGGCHTHVGIEVKISLDRWIAIDPQPFLERD